MIKITNLNKTYGTGDMALHALKNINLTIEEGEFTALAGPSGCGKTTLLNCVGALDTFQTGSIELGDFTFNSLDDAKQTTFRREKLGFIFQSYNLIPVLTAYENVALTLNLLKISKEETHQRVIDILKQVGLEGRENSLPSKMSGGQQQRVAIARALVKKPSLILADEPTANLDSKTSAEILDLMGELNQKLKVTFLFSTHDLEVMDRARRIVRIKDGIIQSDTTK